MGFLSWLFGFGASSSGTIERWILTKPIRFPFKIETPLGGEVTLLTFAVDVGYRLMGSTVSVTSIRSVRRGKTLDVFASRRGEAWQLSSGVRKKLNQKVFPDMRKTILADEPRLLAAILKKARVPSGASDKQKRLARQMKIQFDEGISKAALGALISQKIHSRKKR